MEAVKLTGLWKEKDKNGNTFLSGRLNQITSIMVMPNTFKKEGDKGPDYHLYLKPSPKKDAAAPAQAADGGL